MHKMEAASGLAGGAVAPAAQTVPNVNPTWTFIGPQPIQAQGNFTGTPIGNAVAMTGRITAVAADQRGVIVAGAASGGVWISTDNGTNFHQTFDDQPTQAIGALAIDSGTNPSTIYAATGEGNSSFDSLYGQGIFKSTDLGQSWNEIGLFDHVSFTSLTIDPNNSQRMFAGATNGLSASAADAAMFESDASKAGLWSTTDGGSTWFHYPESTFSNCDLLGTGTGQAPCPADDVKVDPANSLNVYVAIDGSQIYRSTDGGVTFSTSLIAGASFQGRQSLAIGPPQGAGQPGTVYAMIGDRDGIAFVGLFVSTDGALSWNSPGPTAPTVPTFQSVADNVSIDGLSQSNITLSFYDQALLASQTAPGTLYFGGVGLYKSTDSGHSWAFLPENGGIHADQHALALNPSNQQILVGNDGGLYSFDPANPTAFTSLNQHISATQIQGIGAHPTDFSKVIAGFQGNGTQLYSGALDTWVGPESENGDGGFALFDLKSPNFLYHDFSPDSTNTTRVSASSDGGAHWCDAPGPAPCNVAGAWTPNLAALLSDSGDLGAAFYAPMAVDPQIPQRVLFGAHGIYVSTDGMAHWGQQEDFDLTSQGLVVGAPCLDSSCAMVDLEFAASDHSRAWALAQSSLDGSVAFALNNTTQGDIQLDANNADGGQWNDQTANLNAVFPVISTQATSIGVDPHNPSVAYLSLSGFSADTGVGHIYKTSDLGRTWVEADGSSNNGQNPGSSPLPDIPVLKILVDNTDNSGTCGSHNLACSKSVYAGTDIGVFHSSDGGNTWQPFNLGVIPAVPVYDMVQNNNGVIFIGTHGRGSYSSGPLGTPSPGGSPTATATPNGSVLSVASSVTLKAVGIGTGATSTKALVIKNAGKKSGPLSGTISINQPSSCFAVSPSSFSNIASGKSVKVNVTCKIAADDPNASSPSATMVITSSGGNANVALKGAGLGGKLSVKASVNVNGTTNQTTTVPLVLKNAGKGVMSGSWQAVSTPPYSVAAGTFVAIQPKASVSIPIVFMPTTKGKQSPGGLTISVDPPSTGARTVTLKGVGK